ncbi:Arginine--tRNA ligase, cytoplasmic [Manis javanica]|nr:Arginine--tRNA ligase, cytoplasmic [Manis javanica]
MEPTRWSLEAWLMDRLGQPSEGLEGGLEMAEGVLPLCTRGAVNIDHEAAAFAQCSPLPSPLSADSRLLYSFCESLAFAPSLRSTPLNPSAGALGGPMFFPDPKCNESIFMTDCLENTEKKKTPEKHRENSRSCLLVPFPRRRGHCLGSLPCRSSSWLTRLPPSSRLTWLSQQWPSSPISPGSSQLGNVPPSL